MEKEKLRKDTCPYGAIIEENHRLLAGNGQKGIVKEITRMKVEVENIDKNIDMLSKSFKILANSFQDIDVKERVEILLENKRLDVKEKRNNIIKTISVVVGIVSGLLGAIYLILEHI